MEVNSRVQLGGGLRLEALEGTKITN